MESNIHSLKAQLATATGSERISCLLELAKATTGIDTPRAQQYVTEALTLAQKQGTHVGKCYLYFGIIHMKLGEYAQSLNALIQALEHFDAEQDTTNAARTRMNIGLMFLERNELQNAEPYFLQSLEDARTINDENLASYVYLNLGVLADKKGDPEHALTYYQQALALKKKFSDWSAVAGIHLNIGIIQLARNQLEEACLTTQQAAAQFQQLGDLHSLGLAWNTLGEIRIRQGKFKEAETYIRKALEISQTTGVKSLEIDAYKHLVQLYQRQQDYQNAFECLEHLQQLNTKQFNLEMNQQIAELKTKYESEQKAREAEIYRQKNIELARLVQQLQELNREKTELMGIVSHDLKNPLTGIISAIKLLLQEEDKLTPDTRLRFMEGIQNNSEWMLKMITKLLDANQIDTGYLKVTPIYFDPDPLLQDILCNHQQRAKAKAITLQYNPPPTPLAVYADLEAFRHIVDNLISNAIKYSHPERRVYVRLLERGHRIRLEVQDQGQGLTKDDRSKLFRKFQKLSAKPTGGEYSTGLGLSIVKKLVEIMNGQVWAESEGKNKGSTFIVELPRSGDGHAE